jgi:hypothetical protein
MIVEGPYMIMLRKIVFAALLVFAILGATGCFYESSTTASQPVSTACEPGNKNCQSETETTGFWGFVF